MANGAGKRGRSARRPSEIPAAGWRDIALRIKVNLKQDNVTLAAAGVAFYAFMAIIPAMGAAMALVGLFTTPGEAAGRIEDMFGTLPTEARKLLADQLEALTKTSSTGLGLTAAVGIVLALWTATSGMAHLMQAVNIVYDEVETRGFLRLRAIAGLLTLAATGFVALALGAIAVVPAVLSTTALGGPARAACNLALWPVLVGGFAVGLGILFRYGPDRDDARWRWLSTGSIVGVALWLVGSLGFRLYAGTFGSYNATYGALAGVVLLLLWLFISALAVLIAGEVNAETEHQTAVDTTKGPDQPMGRRGAAMADTLGEPLALADDDRAGRA